MDLQRVSAALEARVREAYRGYALGVELLLAALGVRTRAPEAQIAGLGLDAILERILRAVPVPTVHALSSSAASTG